MGAYLSPSLSYPSYSTYGGYGMLPSPYPTPAYPSAWAMATYSTPPPIPTVTVSPSPPVQPRVTPTALKSPLDTPPPKASSLQDRLFVGISFAAMLGNLLGGAALVASSLPGLFSKSLQGRIKKGGLTGIAIAIALGCLAEIGVGLKQKQPTVTIANSIFLAATPYFIKETPFARGLFLFLMGAYYAGYANIIGNRFDARSKGTLRQSEVPLTDLAKTATFMAEDHQRLLDTLPRLPQILSGLAADLSRASDAVGQGKKLYIEPSADRVRLSALCHYVGGALLMLASKRLPWLASLGSILAGIGGVSSNLEWFAVGTQRNDAIGAALKIGMPMQALGKMFFHTNTGYGIEVMGQGLSYALSSELNQNENTNVGT